MVVKSAVLELQDELYKWFVEASSNKVVISSDILM